MMGICRYHHDKFWLGKPSLWRGSGSKMFPLPLVPLKKRGGHPSLRSYGDSKRGHFHDHFQSIEYVLKLKAMPLSLSLHLLGKVNADWAIRLFLGIIHGLWIHSIFLTQTQYLRLDWPPSIPRIMSQWRRWNHLNCASAPHIRWLMTTSDISGKLSTTRISRAAWKKKNPNCNYPGSPRPSASANLLWIAGLPPPSQLSPGQNVNYNT